MISDSRHSKIRLDEIVHADVRNESSSFLKDPDDMRHMWDNGVKDLFC